MTRYLKIAGLWIGVPVGLLLTAAGFIHFGFDLVPKLIVSAFGGGMFLVIAVAFAQLGRQPKEVFKGPAMFMITVNIIFGSISEEILLTSGLILGTIICCWMLELSRKFSRTTSAA